MDIDFQRVLIFYIPLVVSLAVHEWAHAWSAHKLGDDTAAEHGRLTLNPLVHMDLMGTVILPLYILISGSPFFFGWAKPVPVNPFRFRRGVSVFSGMLLTSLAGPFSNLLLAILCSFSLVLVQRYTQASPAVLDGLRLAMVLNVVLMIFNLLPVPPLDGHRMLPLRVQESLQPHSMLIFIGLLALIWTSGGLLLVPVRGVVQGILYVTKLVV